MLNKFMAAFGVSNSPIDKYWKGIIYNDCERLNITITKPTITPGQKYAQAVVVHLLTKEENKNNHNLYMDVIDEGDNRLDGSILKGQNNNISLTARIDKPPNEFGTNFSLFTQDTVSCWVDVVPGIGKVASDKVSGFSTRWGGPIVGGQDYGHISYYVIWQIRDGDTPIPPDPEPEPPPTGDCAELQRELAELRARVKAALKVLEAGQE